MEFMILTGAGRRMRIVAASKAEAVAREKSVSKRSTVPMDRSRTVTAPTVDSKFVGTIGRKRRPAKRCVHPYAGVMEKATAREARR